MSQTINVLFLAAEAEPFVKVGGLGDVAGTLPKALRALSNEVREKLACVRPATLGQAARIPGVTPAAISILAVHVRSAHERRGGAEARRR